MKAARAYAREPARDSTRVRAFGAPFMYKVLTIFTHTRLRRGQGCAREHSRAQSWVCVKSIHEHASTCLTSQYINILHLRKKVSFHIILTIFEAHSHISIFCNWHVILSCKSQVFSNISEFDHIFKKFLFLKINDFGEINIWKYWLRQNVLRKKFVY